MTPWDSDWAGGTEGSDIRIAKEFAVDVRRINSAKEVASEVFPLERAVTPFSEYKLRLGIAIMIEDGIRPKSVEAVRAWVNAGGKLKVGGDVLVGLKRWETLVPKTPEVDKLLSNMKAELETAMGKSNKRIAPGDLPGSFTEAQRHIALGYQGKGLEFVSKVQGTREDLSPLLLAPHVLHKRRKTLAAGTQFELLINPTNYAKRAQVSFGGFGTTPTGDLLLTFSHAGLTTTIAVPDPDAAKGGLTGQVGPRKADPSSAHELACEVPGELMSYAVKAGDVLTAGQPICTLESMKMEVVISAPPRAAGRTVRALPVEGRSASAAGTKLAPGDLLLELVDSKA